LDIELPVTDGGGCVPATYFKKTEFSGCIKRIYVCNEIIYFVIAILSSVVAESHYGYGAGGD